MGQAVECSGGSAANTLVGVASLGGRSAFVGRVHDDRLGSVFRSDLERAGVVFETGPATSGPPTGRSLILVTPDAQRTMQTFLGAAADLRPEDVDAATVADSRVVYLEGYLFDPPPAKEAFLKAAECAHRAGRQVALSLSDSFCVDRHRDAFRDLVESHVDILFGNADEIVSLYRASGADEAIERLRGRDLLAAVTLGADGSAIVSGDEVVRVPAEPVEQVVDTTGAGDLYAAGFLYGWTHGFPPATCARFGGAAAAEIISHYGARPQVSLADIPDSASDRSES
jgi:sugar/nucleoside kinase (ribokinase family)